MPSPERDLQSCQVVNTTTSNNLGNDALFTQYIDVVNRAIGNSRDDLYGKAIDLWDKTIGDEPIAVGVYASDASQPHHWYTVKLSDGTFDLLETGKASDAETDWKISDDHLSKVVDNPQTFIEHPVKLDLNWIKTRVGLS